MSATSVPSKGGGEPKRVEDVRSDLRALSAEVARLNAHRFIRMHNSLAKLIFFNFVRGLAFGLGTVIGASMLISMVAWSFSQIEFLPLIGEWAAEIARVMNEIAGEPERAR